MIKIFKKFVNSQNGSIAIAFAVSLLPILLAVGSAVDYSRLSQYRFKAQEILDAAVMGAAVHYKDTSKSGRSKKIGKRIFAADCVTIKCKDGDVPIITISKLDIIKGTFLSSVDTTFLKIAGIKKLKYGVESEVSLRSAFQEIHLVIDRSASLGIAADKQAIEDLKALTKPYVSIVRSLHSPDGCAFSCHYVDGWEPAGKTTYEMATDAGIRLREDVLLEAMDDALDSIISNASSSQADQIRLAAYVYSGKLVTVSKPAAISANIKQKVKNAKIKKYSTMPYRTFPKLAKIIGKSGTGDSRASPEKTMILITDGVTDDYTRSKPTPIDSKYCDTIKNEGVRMVVININYPKLVGNYFYEESIADIYDDIAPALKSCASRGYYFEANESDDIRLTMLEMTKSIFNSNRLAFSK